ncbi:MAG: serine hydrolase [Cyanobacteria bacterium P01_F01_bin.53]
MTDANGIRNHTLGANNSSNASSSHNASNSANGISDNRAHNQMRLGTSMQNQAPQVPASQVPASQIQGSQVPTSQVIEGNNGQPPLHNPQSSETGAPSLRRPRRRLVTETQPSAVSRATTNVKNNENIGERKVGERVDRSDRRSRRERRRAGGAKRLNGKRSNASSSHSSEKASVGKPRKTRVRAAAPQKASTERRLKIAGSPTPPSRTTFGKQPSGKTAAKGKDTKRSQPGQDTLSGLRARRRNARRSFKAPRPLLYLSRLVVAGLGIAAIGGTILTFRPTANAPSAARTESALATDAEKPPIEFPITLNQEIAALKAEIEELPNTYPGLTPKVFYVDVDTGNYVNVGGQESVAAASTIKLPILLAFFQAIDEGRLDRNQTMAIAPEQIAEGSGEMQLSPPGTQFTALEVATRMIVNSDNTATNMMIDLMGGSAVLNERFKAYGLEETQLTSPLPDLEGSNTTSARDLVHTLLLISQGDGLTMQSRDRILNILNRTYNKSLIPFGMVEREALTYNKTGDIRSVLGDASLVDLSNGKRYAIAVMVERPANDGRAAELIHKISDRTYQEADKIIQPAVSPLGDPNGASSAAEAAAETVEATPDTASPDRASDDSSTSPASTP